MDGSRHASTAAAGEQAPGRVPEAGGEGSKGEGGAETATSRRRALGVAGERFAERYLVARGMTVVGRNWRCSTGEIDLVLDDRGTTVVCEVKTRRGTSFGQPVEAITRAKLRRLRRLAGAWAAEHAGCGALRIDVVGLLLHPDGTWSVTHLEGVG